MRKILLAVILLIIYGSLYPWQFHRRQLNENPALILLHTWPYAAAHFQLKDDAVNILLYLPIGLFGFLSISRTRSKIIRIAAAIGTGFVLSCSIEMLQLFDARRTTSAMDVLTNTAGSFIGAIAGALLEPFLHSAGTRFSRIRPRQFSSAALLLMFATFQLFPFFPDFSPYRVVRKIWALEALGFVVSAFLASLIEWTAMARLVETAIDPRWTSLLFSILLLLIPARLLVFGRTMNLSELAGAVAVFLIWLIPARRNFGPTWVIPLLFAVLVVYRGLQPFHFSSTPAQFHWIPFEGSLEADNGPGFQALLGKLFIYGTFVWLVRESGLRMPYAAALVATILGSIEAAQMYLPNHVAEITDPLLAVLLSVWPVSIRVRSHQGTFSPR